MATLPHGGLAALDATTGAVDEYMGIDVATNHNWPNGPAKAPVGVAKLAASPDGSRSSRSATSRPRTGSTATR